jgi:TonB-linked SusC/RagA family outer membrane protein
MKNLLRFLLVVLVTSLSHAQTINGLVTDSKNNPLPGVNVVCKENGKSASTDFDGKFKIQVEANVNLTFSFIGYETTTAKATLDMKVVLVESNTALNEIVVVGYGTKKAGSITGSIAHVTAQDIVKTPSQSAIQAIQGKVAGVNIVASDEPGASPTIRIRGLGTLLGGRDPLYVIDGVESYSLNGLSPNEIASMDILKDASSLAIYGQKAANGAVIISTKKGKKGEIKVNYDSYYGQKYIQKKVKMADSYRYAYYNNTAVGSSSYFNFNQPYNTDWLSEITDTGEVMNHYISLSGGNDNANYYLGITNYKENGILQGSEFDRTNINSRNEFKALDGKLKISPNINLTIAKSNPKPVSAFTNAYKQSPIVPVYFPNGRWGVPLRNPDTGLIDINGSDRFNNVGNPVAQLYYTKQGNKNITISGSMGAELQLTKDFKLNSNFGATYNIGKSYDFNDNANIWLSQNATLSIANYEATFGPKTVIYNTLQQYRGESYEWNWDNYATYKKSFGKHDLTAVAGMSRTTKYNNESISGTRYNVSDKATYWSLDLSTYNTLIAPDAVVRNSHSTPIVSIAYFSRLEYEYDNKYLVSASLRKEGISAFQDVKKWAYFPSLSLGWVINQEEFMQKFEFINYLKLRGGYGEVGNGNTTNSLNNLVFGYGYNYAFGANQAINPGSNQPYQVDPNLTWETMKEFDFGLDFKVLSNKLSGTIDLYNRISSDIILPLKIPDVLSPGEVTSNAGEVTNKGIELSLRWESQINDNLKYWISGNYSHNKNELTKVYNSYFANTFGGGLSNGEYTKEVLLGHPLGSFYVYDVTGINEDGAFTYSDERVIAGSYIPTYTYGLSFGGTYRNFDFSVDTYGVGGNKLYNGKKAQHFGGENIEFAYLDSFWTPSNPNAANPKPYNQTPKASTYFIEDGAYLRINNITVGYTIPKKISKIQKIRVYATAINPFVFTKYSGYSPEIAGDNNGNPLGTAGIELDAYPTNKTFLLGLNVSL